MELQHVRPGEDVLGQPRLVSKRIVIIRSDACTSAASECSADFIFPTPIVVKENEMAQLELVKASFAHSFYLIDEFTDKLIVSGVTYTLTHANYNAVTLLTHLRSLLPISVDYSPGRYRYTFSHSSAFTVDTGTTCLTAIGLIAAQLDTSTTSIEGAHVADLHGHHFLNLRTNFLVHSLDSSVGTDAHLFARIPVEGDAHDTSSMKYEHFKPAYPMTAMVTDRVISEISCELVDEARHAIHFNGIPFSLKFVLSVFQVAEKMTRMIQKDATSREAPDPPLVQIRQASRIDEKPPPREPRPARARKQRRRRKRKAN